jgi:hypothetical protein
MSECTCGDLNFVGHFRYCPVWKDGRIAELEGVCKLILDECYSGEMSGDTWDKISAALGEKE